MLIASNSSSFSNSVIIGFQFLDERLQLGRDSRTRSFLLKDKMAAEFPPRSCPQPAPLRHHCRIRRGHLRCGFGRQEELAGLQLHLCADVRQPGTEGQSVWFSCSTAKVLGSIGRPCRALLMFVHRHPVVPLPAHRRRFCLRVHGGSFPGGRNANRWPALGLDSDEKIPDFAMAILCNGNIYAE